MNDRQQAESGQRVHTFLTSPEWEQAWDTFRDVILAAMQDPKFSIEDVQHHRRLLWAATQAKQKDRKSVV